MDPEAGPALDLVPAAPLRADFALLRARCGYALQRKFGIFIPNRRDHDDHSQIEWSYMNSHAIRPS